MAGAAEVVVVASVVVGAAVVVVASVVVGAAVVVVGAAVVGAAVAGAAVVVAVPPSPHAAARSASATTSIARFKVVPFRMNPVGGSQSQGGQIGRAASRSMAHSYQTRGRQVVHDGYRYPQQGLYDPGRPTPSRDDRVRRTKRSGSGPSSWLPPATPRDTPDVKRTCRRRPSQGPGAATGSLPAAACA